MHLDPICNEPCKGDVGGDIADAWEPNFVLIRVSIDGMGWEVFCVDNTCEHAL